MIVGRRLRPSQRSGAWIEAPLSHSRINCARPERACFATLRPAMGSFMWWSDPRRTRIVGSQMVLRNHIRFGLRELDQRAVAYPNEIEFPSGMKAGDAFIDPGPG